MTVSALNSLALAAYALGQEAEAGRFLREAIAAALAIDALPALLESIAATAQQLADSDRSEQMVAYLTLVLRHPATHALVRLQAERFLDELAIQFLPQVFAAAQARSVTNDPQAVAKALLNILASSDEEDRERPQPQPLVEPLSNREIEVLR